MKHIAKKMIFIAGLAIYSYSCKEDPKTNAASQEPAAEEITPTADEQIKEIMALWPGTYNNDKQIAEAEARGEAVWRLDDSGEGGYLQVQSHYIELDKPEIGEHVLYVEEYRDHDSMATYRQRIYTIYADSIGGVKVKMWPFKDKQKYIGAWKDRTLLDSLTVDEISAYPDFCDLKVQRVNGVYEMKMNGKDCAFGDRYFSYQVRLAPDRFGYRDKITVLSTDSLVSTAANFKYHDLDRVKD